MSRLSDVELLAAAEALDRAYAEADAFDAAHVAPSGVCEACYALGYGWDEPRADGSCYQCGEPIEHCDEMAELHRAALNRGQP